MKNLVQRLTHRTISEACYWICNHLEQHTDRRTRGTRLAAGDAIAVSWVLDWKRALDEYNSELPTGVGSALGVFSPNEWLEVMSHADLSESCMASVLRPEWAHLRRKPIR